MTSQPIIQSNQNKCRSFPKQLKTFIFQLFSSTNTYRNTDKTFGALLMLLCFLQIASFFKFHIPNEEIDEFQSKYRPISVLMNFSMYFYPDFASKDFISSMEILIYCLIIFLTILIPLIKYQSLSSISFFVTAFLLRYAFLIFQWVLFLPSLQVLIQTVSFTLASDIPRSVIHIILIFLIVILQCLLCYFNLISSTDNHDFFYVKDATISFNLFFLQVLSVLLGNLIYHFAFFLFIGYLIVFAMLIHTTVASFRHCAFYSKAFLRTYLVLLCMLYERFINSMINKYTTYQLSKPFHTYNVVTISVMAFAYVLIQQIFFKNGADYSLRLDLNKIKSTRSFVKFFTSINDIVHTEQAVSKEYHIKKMGLIMHHLVSCSKEEKCLLKSKDELYLPRIKVTSQQGVPAYYDYVKCVFMIKELFSKYYQLFQFDFEFCLCYILFIIYTIGNNELALSEIEMSQRFVSLSLSQEFIMYLLKDHVNSCILSICEQQIESSEFDSIKLKAVKSNSSTVKSRVVSGRNKESSGYINEIGFLHSNAYDSTWAVTSMLNVINYDRVSTSIKNYIYLCLDTKRELWKQFLNEDIVIEEIFQTGTRFFEYKARLALLWRELNLISDDQPDTDITRIYCDYLERICDDKIESRFILDKTPIFISNTPDELYNNRYKADTSIVIIEVNSAYNPGKITYINQPLVSMLGYRKNELIDNNIKGIIPGDIGRYHDEIITSYFEKGRSDILKKTLNTLSVKTKEKYLIPIHLLITILPNLGKTMEGIGLIRPLQKKTVETIITTESGVIEALTENVGHLLNITPSLIEKSRIYVQAFFPELMKAEKGGIPWFMTEEFFSHNKPIDLKVNILCPSKNSIDKTKLKVKTKNIFINQAQAASTANDYLRNIQKTEQKLIQYVININPVQTSNQNAAQSLKSSNVNSPSLQGKHTNYLQRSLFTQSYGRLNQYSKTKEENHINFSPQHERRTPEMEKMYSYRQALIDSLSKSIGNPSSPSEKLQSKLIDILTSMLIAHDSHSLTEKAEVVLIHLGMKVYNNSIPVRILMIPSEMLFEIKKIDEDFSFTSEVNIAEKKEDNLIQNAANEEDINLFFETGSVSGKDANLALQKHLKKLKKDKENSFLFHKSIGLLMALTVIATDLIIILLSYRLYRYVMKFNSLLKEAFTVNTLLVDIAKYSIIDQLELKYSIDNNYAGYNFSAKAKRISRSKDILSLIDNYFGSIQGVYSSERIDSAYNERIIDFLLTNQRLNMTFINSIYREVSDAIDGNLDSLKAVSVNFVSSIREHFTIINDLYNANYLVYSDNQFTIKNFIVTISLLILIGFLIVILNSYRTKQNEQARLLSAYEQIKNEEIELIISRLDAFEAKYVDSFKQFDEYKTKKVTFQKENTQFLFKKYQNRLKRDKKEEERKWAYNILSKAKVEEEIEEKTKKTLINRKKMTKKYVVSFLAIFSIVFLYSAYFYYEICWDQLTINKTQTIVFNLFLSKFLQNYLSLKLVNIIFRRQHIISRFDRTQEENFKAFLNTTHAQFNDLTVQINNNPQLFLPNITEIMTGKICSIISIDYCTSKEIKFRGENGLRAISSFYLKSIDDAFLYFNYSYKRIDDLGAIFSNEKYVIVNLLIEDLHRIYDEVFLQLNASLERLFTSAIVNFVVISIIFGGLFIIGLIYKLSSFIEGIKQEESLCKKLVAELPYEVVQWNYDIQKQLTGLIVHRA